MIYGTPYFPSKEDATKYYSQFGYSEQQVESKISNKEIHIGEPPGLNEYRKAILHRDQGGSFRYFIHDITRK